MLAAVRALSERMSITLLSARIRSHATQLTRTSKVAKLVASVCSNETIIDQTPASSANLPSASWRTYSNAASCLIVTSCEEYLQNRDLCRLQFGRLVRSNWFIQCLYYIFYTVWYKCSSCLPLIWTIVCQLTHGDLMFIYCLFYRHRIASPDYLLRHCKYQDGELFIATNIPRRWLFDSAYSDIYESPSVEIGYIG